MIPTLGVISRTSAEQYRGSSKSIKEIGRELGVDYLLVGKVRWDKPTNGQSRVRVSPELIEVAGSRSRWQQPFEAVLSDVFQVQADIAGRGIANPTAMMLAGCMLMEHLGQHDVSNRIRDAIKRTLEARKTVTPDVGGTARTGEYADAVIASLK